MEEKDVNACEEVVEEVCENEETTQEKKGFLFGSKKKIEELESEIERLNQELNAAKNAYYKAYADADNLKKRLQAESELVKKYRIQSFASEVLPVIDNLERALVCKSEDNAVLKYVKGFEMIYQQLIHILGNEGVKEIEALDKPFDPNFHNALMQEAKEGVEPGVVIEVLQKGYVLKDRVLRAALVKVSE